MGEILSIFLAKSHGLHTIFFLVESTQGVPRRCTRPFRCSSTQGAVPTQTLPLSVTSSLSLDAKRRVGQDEWVMKMMVKHDEH